MPDTELKFIVEHNAGKMAKWLRMAGFDARLFTGADDAALLSAALAENRILLTRDRRIMKRRVIVGGRIKAILIESDRVHAQVQQVLSALKVDKSRFRPFTLCLECNRRLEERVKETIKNRVPPYVYLTQEHFAECPACDRIYWQGTHWQAMLREIEGTLSFGPDFRDEPMGELSKTPTTDECGICSGAAVTGQRKFSGKR